MYKRDLKVDSNGTKTAGEMKFVASTASLVSNSAPTPKARVRVTCMNPEACYINGRCFDYQYFLLNL